MGYFHLFAIAYWRMIYIYIWYLFSIAVLNSWIYNHLRFCRLMQEARDLKQTFICSESALFLACHHCLHRSAANEVPMWAVWSRNQCLLRFAATWVAHFGAVTSSFLSPQHSDSRKRTCLGGMSHVINLKDIFFDYDYQYFHPRYCNFHLFPRSKTRQTRQTQEGSYAETESFCGHWGRGGPMVGRWVQLIALILHPKCRRSKHHHWTH